MICAKALTDSDRSQGIVVSFDAVWRQKILDATFSVVIRKRVPLRANPSLIYFHINSPYGEMLARAKIISIKTMSVEEAIGLHEKIDLSIEEIKSYVGTSSGIGSYVIKEFEISKKKVITQSLKESLIYSPPQSFLFLSHQGKAVIDQLCHFRPNNQ